ncbi:hypothetical protein MMC10_011048 [Thelotrema lepadinum]|nr:hypothetical protein [Thelotrema lepadinum]
MNSTVLTVELDFYNVIHDHYYCEEHLGRLETVWKECQQIANFFKLLEGYYKNFFVWLSVPWGSTAEQDTVRWQRERILEKRIMGSDYDAGSRGKYRSRLVRYVDWIVDRKPIYEPDGTMLTPPHDPFELDERYGPNRLVNVYNPNE